MKILFTIPTLTYSGAPKMMAWVANQMAARGHEVRFVAFFSDEQARALHEKIEMRSLNVTRSKSRLARNTTKMAQALWRLHRTVKKEKPDVVVTFLDSVGSMYLPIARFFTKCKTVASERVDPYTYRGKMAQARFYLMRFADGTVFQTEGARRFFKERKRIYDNSAVIPNPVVIGEKTRALRGDAPTFEERDDRVVTVGRLSLTQKRQDVLLDAFKIVAETRPELKLVIYGDGPDKGKIQELIDQKGLAERATLAGRVDGVENAIFNARAFALSSDFEGIPNALIEAMALGLPCIATDCPAGGPASLIETERNGLLVPVGDPRAMTRAMCRLADDAALADRLGENAAKIRTRLDANTVAQQWRTYLERVIKQTRKV